MKSLRSPFGWVFFGLFCIGILVSSCDDAIAVKGRWQEIGAQATLEFRSDGTFTAVDNQGLSVRGTYRVKGDGQARFDIAHPGGSIETIHAHIAIGEDTLIVISDGGGEGERYRRVP